MRSPIICTILYAVSHGMALYAARPYIALLVTESGGDSMAVGLIAAAYSVAQVMLALPAGKWIDKLGAHCPAIYGAIVFILGVIGLANTKNLYAMAVYYFFLGASHMLALLSVQHVVTGLYSSLRNKVLGIYVFANSVGMFAGPYIGGHFQNWLGTGRGFYGAAVIGVVCWFCSLFMPKRTQTKDGVEKGTIIQLLGRGPIIRTLIIGSTVQFSFEMTISYLPLYGREMGLSNAAIGTIFSVNGFAIMLVRPLLNSIISFYEKNKIMKICLVLGGFSLAGYSLVREYTLLIIMSGISGMAMGFMSPLTLMAVTDAAPQNRRSQVLALRLMGNYIAQTISPLIFGLMASMIGVLPVFWISGASLTACATLVDKKNTASVNNMPNRE